MNSKQEVCFMCDAIKYSRMFQDIKQLQPEDTLQHVLEAEN